MNSPAETTPPPPVPETRPAEGKTERASRPSPPKMDQLPPYRVLLHNDDHNDMQDVVKAIRQLVGHSAEQSRQIMMTAHTRGLALLTVTHKERAELLAEQFRSKNLTVTIEPA